MKKKYRKNFRLKASYFNMDVGIIETTEFHWKIDINCFKDKEVGSYLLSPKFSSKKSRGLNHQWQLMLHPNGNNNRNKGFLSLFLYNLSSEQITASYNFSLMDRDGCKIYKTTREVDSHSFGSVKTASGNNGFPQFFKLSSIMDPETNVLKDNKLTIFCHVRVESSEPEDKSENKEETEDKKQVSRLKFLDSYEQLMTNKEFSDITIQADGKSFYLHKCILTARSVVFEGMFRHDMKEKIQNSVVIEDIRYEVLEELFLFIYTGKVSDSAESMICELLTAAEKYCVEELKSLCEEKMCNSLNKHNAIEYFDSAILNKAEKLETELIKFVSINLEEFIENLEFDILGLKHPEVLLKIMKRHIKMLV